MFQKPTATISRKNKNIDFKIKFKLKIIQNFSIK